MITIQIDNSTVCAGLFGELVKLIETTAGMDYLLAEGCDPKVIDVIRNLKVRDVREIAGCMKTFHFSFEVADLSGEVMRLTDKREDQALCEYFVRHGASRHMVAEFWRMPLADVTEMRRILLVEGTAGRPNLPRDFDLRQRIHEAWNEIGKAHPGESKRRLIFMLHQCFRDLSIETLYNVITEFDDDEDVAPASKRSANVKTVAALTVTSSCGTGALRV